MSAPLLYRQLLEQLSQWIEPQDKRHLQSESGCMSHVSADWQSIPIKVTIQT